MTEETTLFDGHPAYRSDWFLYLICIPLTFLFGLGIVVALITILKTACTRYTLSTQRLILSIGVLSRRTTECEIYRIQDIAIEEPFVQRILGLGNLVLTTSDNDQRRIVLRALPNVRGIKEDLRKAVENLKTRKQVREFNVS